MVDPAAGIHELPQPAAVLSDELMPKSRRWTTNVLPRILAIAGFLAVWQLVVPYLPTRQIPTPTAIGEFMIAELQGDTAAKDTVYVSFAITLARLAIGLLTTFVLGTLIGVAMGLSRRVDAFFHDFVIGDMSMPFVIYALIAAMWFGLVFVTPVIVVVLAAIPFIITNVEEGVRNVPRELVDMARAFGVPRTRMVRSVVIPSLMPFMFAGFRYALSLGWKALAVAEVFGADRGAGWIIRFWYNNGVITGLFAYLAFFVLIAIVIDVVLFRGLSNRVFRWRNG